MREFVEKPVRLLMAGTLAIALAGCEGSGITNQQAGAVLGAGAGVLLGSQIGSGSGRTAAMIAGGLAGAWLGSTLGSRLDNRDRQMMSSSTNQALGHADNGQPVSWSNAQSGNSGTTTPTSTYKAPSGAVCRQFDQSITVAGESEARKGTACQQADGSWKVMT